MRGAMASVTCSVATVLLLAGGAPPAAAETGDPVLINEVVIAHADSPQTCEFVELYGIPFTSLEGLSLLAVYANRWPAVISVRWDFLPGQQLGANGFFLLGNSLGLQDKFGVNADVEWGAEYFRDWGHTIALVETSSLTSSVGDSISFEEVVHDAVGIKDSWSGSQFFFGAPAIGPWGPFLPAGVRRAEDGVDTDKAADWDFASYEMPGDNTPTSSGPAVQVERSTWGSVKACYR